MDEPCKDGNDMEQADCASQDKEVELSETSSQDPHKMNTEPINEVHPHEDTPSTDRSPPASQSSETCPTEYSGSPSAYEKSPLMETRQDGMNIAEDEAKSGLNEDDDLFIQGDYNAVISQKPETLNPQAPHQPLQKEGGHFPTNCPISSDKPMVSVATTEAPFTPSDNLQGPAPMNENSFNSNDFIPTQSNEQHPQASEDMLLDDKSASENTGTPSHNTSTPWLEPVPSQEGKRRLQQNDTLNSTGIEKSMKDNIEMFKSILGNDGDGITQVPQIPSDDSGFPVDPHAQLSNEDSQIFDEAWATTLDLNPPDQLSKSPFSYVNGCAEPSEDRHQTKTSNFGSDTQYGFSQPPVTHNEGSAHYNFPQPTLEPDLDFTDEWFAEYDPQSSERQAFLQHEKEYEAKRTNGTVERVDEIRFLRAVKAEQTRQKRVKDERFKYQAGNDCDAEGANEADQTDEDYMPSGSVKGGGYWSDSSYISDDRRRTGPQKRSHHQKPSKGRRRTALKAEITEIDDEDSYRAGWDVVKSQGKRKAQPTEQGKDNSTVPKKHSTRKRKSKNESNETPKPKRKKASANNRRSGVNKLGNAKDTANSAPAAFKDHRKDKALKELVASCNGLSRKEARADANVLRKAIRSLIHRAAPSPPDGWLLTGMKEPLKAFQVVGLGRMRELERDDDFKGGILAFEKGFGKTVTMIANIIDAMPARRCDRLPTLIVVPPNLTSQWVREFEKCCKDKPPKKVIVFDSKGIYLNVLDYLQSQDVVITTYHELGSSYPKTKCPTNFSQEQKEAWWKQQFELGRGALHLVKWHRVVIDECQSIKNYKAYVSTAAHGLMAEYRWLISADILTDRVAESYSYLKFLKCPYIGTFQEFQRNCLRGDYGLDRLHEFIKSRMILFDSNDKILGKPIVDLPESQYLTWPVHFSAEEAKAYEHLNMSIERAIDIARNDPTLSKEEKKGKALELWVKRRQFISHPWCCDPNDGGDKLGTRGPFHYGNYIKASTEESNGVVGRLRKELRALKMQPQNWKKVFDEKDSNATDHPYSDSTQENVTTDSERASDWMNEGAREENTKGRSANDPFAAKEPAVVCAKCHQTPDEPWFTSCFHHLCNECVRHLKQIPAPVVQLIGHCPVASCGQLCGATVLDTHHDVGSGNEHTSNPKRKTRRKPICSHRQTLGSSKIRALKAAILEEWAVKPDVKIIVYVQFIRTAKIIQDLCNYEQWGSIMYTGEIPVKTRNKSLDNFKINPEIKIMIATLRTGSEGLNITEATRVIIYDLYWNVAKENQGYGRVARMTQKHPTRMIRLTIEGSYDDDVMFEQSRKKADINRVLVGDPEAGNKSEYELLELFEPPPADIDEEDEAQVSGFQFPEEMLDRKYGKAEG